MRDVGVVYAGLRSVSVKGCKCINVGGTGSGNKAYVKFKFTEFEGSDPRQLTEAL